VNEWMDGPTDGWIGGREGGRERHGRTDELIIWWFDV